MLHKSAQSPSESKSKLRRVAHIIALNNNKSYTKSHKARTTKARWTVDSMEIFGNQKPTKISKNTKNNI